ncbi:MAG: class I SAM-dependent methyltransferase [Myxococcales bacterium]|nr:class I SAM-dependent methyltransferase [Myxococcales bacterium]
MQELLDRVFKPVEDLLVEAVRPGSGRVLDIGCGTGSTTLAIARRLGAGGRVVGIDISGPMIDAARVRADRDGSTAMFVCGDAQTHAFESANFDVVLSRFGVMFFDDPAQAFANLRRAASDRAEMRFVAWRTAEENPFMTTAERASAPLLPNIPTRPPDAPGQFSFADPQRVQRILEESGWTRAEVHPVDVACSFPEEELVRWITRLGPLGRVLHEADDRTRARVVETVRPEFEPYVHGREVRFTAACWLVLAQAANREAT